MTDLTEPTRAPVALAEPTDLPSLAHTWSLTDALSAPDVDEGAPFDLRASLARLRGELRRAIETMTVPQFALGLGATTMVLGLALLPSPLELGHLMLGIGAIMLILAVVWAPSIMPLQVQNSANQGIEADQPSLGTVVGLLEDLERKIEHLKDTQWELNESEFRYRDLLDAQDDVILRRDADGRLTYANRAFGRVFGLDGAQMLGKPFRPIVHEGETPGSAVSAQDTRRTYTQRIETAQGARWFAWDEQKVAASDATTSGHGPSQFQCVGRDITDAVRAQTELAEARDAAQAASRAKSRFLAVMSHEIRTPMNGILGMTSLLAETALTPEQDTYTRAVGQSAKSLLALIDEILDFSKIEAGKLELRANPFALETCVQNVVELLAPRAHEKGLQIAWSVAPAVPRTVLGDEARLRQILMNLAGNAIKFTERGGVTIEVGASPPTANGAGDRHSIAGLPLQITVADTGIGIAPEALASIFNEFEQTADWRTRRHAGTGLGLAISRHLAEAMGGTITADSQRGAGSTFTLDLKLSPAQQSGTTGDVLAPLRSAKRVLIVMEPRIEAQAMAMTLRAHGCVAEVTDAAHAASQIAIAGALLKPFDVLLVDAGAASDQAGTILGQMRASQPNAEAADRVRGIVAIKAGQRERLMPFRAEGFAGYLVRPVRPASLLAQVSITGTAAQPAPAPIVGQADLDRGVKGARPTSAHEALPAWRPNVLLAEDNDIGALLACAMLDKSGCDVTHVRTGSDAISAFQASIAEGASRPFDLILMDVHMPVLDGLEATRHLQGLRRADGEGAEAPCPVTVPPIVALTANAFAEDRAQCLEAGMVDYLAKPFVRNELMALIGKWCRPTPLDRGHGAIEDGAMAPGAVEDAA